MLVIFGGLVLVRWSEANRRSTLIMPAADEAGIVEDWSASD